MKELKVEDVFNFINEYKTTYNEGFTDKEINEILKEYTNISEEHFYAAKFGDTIMKIGDDYVTHHGDMEACIKCGIEKRQKTEEEFD